MIALPQMGGSCIRNSNGRSRSRRSNNEQAVCFGRMVWCWPGQGPARLQPIRIRHIRFVSALHAPENAGGTVFSRSAWFLLKWPLLRTLSMFRVRFPLVTMFFSDFPGGPLAHATTTAKAGFGSRRLGLRCARSALGTTRGGGQST